MSRHAGWWTSAAVLLLPFVAVDGRRGGERRIQRDVVRLDGARLRLDRDRCAGASPRRRGDASTSPGSRLPPGSASTRSSRRSGRARPSVAIDNGQRSLEYLAGITAALLVVRRGRLTPLAERARARRRRRLGLLARDAALSRSLRRVQRRRRLPALRADRLLERARHLRGDRVAARARRLNLRTRARASRPRGRCARPAHRDPVLHVQPRRTGRARGRHPRRVCAEPATPSTARRFLGARADPGCRGADRLSGRRA